MVRLSTLSNFNFLCSLAASVTSSGVALRSKSVIVMEKEKIYLQLNQFQSKVISYYMSCSLKDTTSHHLMFIGSIYMPISFRFPLWR